MKPQSLVLLAALLATGCQVSAQVGTPRKAVVVQKARALPLADVRVTGGPLKHAQDLDAQYLLSLEPDRMMAFLRKSAGLEPKAQGYGGWDGAGRQLTGHIAGHYLSGVSLMYAATGDARFKERADYLVAELKAVQDKQGDGYIGAQADKDGVDGKVRFEDLARGDHPLRRLRPERPVVAVVRPAQDLRRPARRVPLCRQPRRRSRSRSSSRPGPRASSPSSTPPRRRRCSPPSSAA